MVTITIIKSIICQRPLNVTIYIVIFVLFLFFIHQWNITHQVYGLYFGNNIVINSGNVSSSFTKGQMSSVERGYPYVVWVDKNNTIYFSASHENGTKFSSPIALSSNNTLAFSPQIVATEKGGVYVVWVDKNNATGDSNIVFRGSNDSGKSFDSSVRLNRNPNQISLSFSPQIAASENGSIFVTWPENTLQFKEILDGGNIFGRTVSLNNHVVLPLSAQIVSAENGNIYLAWAEKTDGLNNDAVLMFKRISQYYFDRR